MTDMTDTTQTTDPPALPAETHVGRTALRVADREETAEFYPTVIGLEVLDRDGAATTLGVAEVPLLMLEDADVVPERRRAGAGLYHTAFRVPTRAALGNALTRIRANWRLDGASDHRVGEALYLTDPGGNGVEVYRDYPREEWPVTDGRVEMATDPLDLAGVEAAATGESTAPPGTDVGHVHLEVTSLEAFRDVYVDALGFDLQTTLSGAAFVSAGGYHHHVGANTWHRRTAPSRGRGLAWFEVVVPERDALDAVRERVTDRGIPVIETDGGFALGDPNDIEVRLRAEAPTQG